MDNHFSYCRIICVYVGADPMKHINFSETETSHKSLHKHQLYTYMSQWDHPPFLIPFPLDKINIP